MFLDPPEANPSCRALAAGSGNAGSLSIAAVEAEGCPPHHKKAQGMDWKLVPPSPLL